ncbi:sigma-70 family RNA polymerase sigma factor [Vicingus serpentipes]|uniref:Sigma-70 family RNA polymerase sigma factor n=1 Tax=Vicingus serpentipes TaxID=1926625 RepID=A0A5C6RZK8_9FLAO|nr:sigma-70 family RNA polymerase sigma factor [Vicingus serpentipes]
MVVTYLCICVSYLIDLRYLKDSDLILGLINKQTSAINYFVNNYQQFVYVLCVRILNNNEVAEEITQDVLIKCIEKIEQFKGDSKLKTWVYTVARRETLNYIRINKLETTEISPSIENTLNGDNIIALFDNEDLNETIQYYFNKLSTDAKEMLTLFYLEEMSLKEIAEITKFSESNVRVKLYRARESFKSILTEKDVTLINQLRHG